MSLADIRAEIVAIASSVEGVYGYPTKPTTLGVGDCFPIFDRLDDAFADNYIAYWGVVIVLPPGEEAAVSWFQDKWIDVGDAFMDAGFNVPTVSILPMTIQGAGSVDVMLIEIYREA